ncbi:MAG TPA: glutaredoxin domain-containing protein [Spirochaetota bacterium]|nr:glutaredoxin domain-containing protein [Spirochaetota bacterium]
MKRSRFVQYSIAGAVIAAACMFLPFERAYSTNSIIMYGSERCGLCMAMRRNLDRENLQYTFYDVNSDSSRNREMWQKVRSVRSGSTSVRFPVMDVNGRVLISPSFSDVKAALTAGGSQDASGGSSAGEQASGGTVMVYGTDRCGYCTALQRNLRRENVPYTFFDVRQNQSKRREMWTKIRSSHPGLSRVGYPVVDVNGKVLIRPSVDEVKRLAAANSSRGGDTAPSSEDKPREEAGNADVTPQNDSGWNIAAIDTARNVDYLSQGEKDVVLLLNKARTNPSLFARTYLESRRNSSNYARECYQQMLSMSPIGALRPSRALSSAAKDHAMDMGQNGRTGHVGTDGSNMSTRIRRHGQWQRTISENCSYGHSDPLEIVLQLLIDHGVPSRGHRKNILNGSSNYVGVSIQPHNGYRFNCVQDFAGGIVER